MRLGKGQQVVAVARLQGGLGTNFRAWRKVPRVRSVSSVCAPQGACATFGDAGRCSPEPAPIYPNLADTAPQLVELEPNLGRVRSTPGPIWFDLGREFDGDAALRTAVVMSVALFACGAARHGSRARAGSLCDATYAGAARRCRPAAPSPAMAGVSTRGAGAPWCCACAAGSICTRGQRPVGHVALQRRFWVRRLPP